MRIFIYLRRFWEIPRMEKVLIFKSIYLICVIKLLVTIFPLKYYSFLFHIEPKQCIAEQEKKHAIKIADKNLNRISKILPWNCNCMIKSLTLKLLLNTLGINSEIIFSIYKPTQLSINAHAFVQIPNYGSLFEIEGFHQLQTLSK
jgi:hypothetical protein